MRQSRVSMERIMAAANSRLMRLAQKMIVGGALLLDRQIDARARLPCGNFNRSHSIRRSVKASQNARHLKVVNGDEKKLKSQGTTTNRLRSELMLVPQYIVVVLPNRHHPYCSFCFYSRRFLLRLPVIGRASRSRGSAINVN